MPKHRRGSDYYIMNAACLFDNKAATIQDTTKEWMDGTILVARRERGYNSYSKLFVHGSGVGYEDGFDLSEGLSRRYTQDTGMGHSNEGKELIIDNIIIVEDGKVVDSGNGIGVNEKRRVWVMK